MSKNPTVRKGIVEDTEIISIDGSLEQQTQRHLSPKNLISLKRSLKDQLEVLRPTEQYKPTGELSWAIPEGFKAPLVGGNKP